jgi:iron complex transport system substrate-binding protein
MKSFKEKEIAVKLIILLSLLWLAACASTFPTPATPTVSLAAPSPSETWPLTVTDDLDRQVTVKARPERIVSLLPSNTEILFAVGAGPQVVGVTSYCNYPPEATSRPQIGGITNQAISVETIVSLEPDLVLASGSQNELIPILAETGLAVIALEPATFEDIQANIDLVGQVTGHADQANGIVGDMRRRAEAVQAKIATIPENERPTVFYEVWDEPLMTAGPRTYIGQMIELAGGRNIFAGVDQDWPQVSAELIVSRNPAVILGPESHAEALAAEQIIARPSWSSIAAVQNNRIYLLDSDMVSRPGPRLINILEEIARDLYPDLF